MNYFRTLIVLSCFWIQVSYSQITLNLGSIRTIIPNIVGIELGGCLTEVQLKNYDVDYGDFDARLRANFKVGLNFIYKLNYSFEIESGLYYKQVGQKMIGKDVSFYYVYDIYPYNSNPVAPIQLYTGTTGTTGTMGTILIGESFQYNSEENYNFKYFQIPFKLKFKFDNFFISGGFYGALLLSGKYKILNYKYYHTSKANHLLNDYEENITTSKDNTFKYDSFTKKYLKLDIGFSGGLGYKIKRFIVKAEYELGLRPVFTYKSNYYMLFSRSYDEKFRYRALSLSLVFLFSDY